MSTAPDLAAPIVGWRAWSVRSDDGFALGSPVVRGFAWEPRAATGARCLRGCPEPPGRDCSCGLYALTEPPTRLMALGAECMVLGCVALWGRVVEATHGYRGAQGYPLALFVPHRPATLDLAVLVGVVRQRLAGLADPVESVDDTLPRMLEHRYAVPVRTLPPTSDLLRSDSLVDACAATVRDEAGHGLAARRLGDPDAQDRFDRALDDLIDALTWVTHLP